MNKKVVKIAGLSVIALALAGAMIFGVSSVAAQDGEPTGPFAGENGPRGPRDDGPFAGYQDVLKAAFTAELGVSVDELDAAHEAGTVRDPFDANGITAEDVRAAKEAARDTVLEQMIADGAITSEEADAIRARTGQFDGPRGPHLPVDEATAEQFQAQIQEAIAGVLGLSVDELEAARLDGIRLEDLADQQGVSIEDMQAAVKTVRESQIAQLLADGTITQEQADQMLEHLDNAPLGGPQGGPGGHRGGPPPDGGQPGSPASQGTDT